MACTHRSMFANAFQLCIFLAVWFVRNERIYIPNMTGSYCDTVPRIGEDTQWTKAIRSCTK